MAASLAAYAGLLIRYVRPQWRRMLALGALLAAAIGLQLLTPWILQRFIDGARAQQSVDDLSLLGVAFIGAAAGLQLVSVADTYVAENVSWTATNWLRRDLALHCLRLDLSFHNAHTPGELIERIDGDVTALGGFFARLVVQVIGNALLFAGVLVILFRIDLRVGAVLTLFALLATLIVSGVRGLAVPHWAAARQASADLFGFLEERLAATEDLRANGATLYVLQRFSALARALLGSQRRASVIGSAVGGATTVLFGLGTVLALGLSAYLYLGGAISLGTAYVIFSYTQMLQAPLQQIIRQLTEFQQAAAGIGRIQALFEMRSAILETPAPTPLPAGALAVAFEGVDFSYAAEEPILRAITFALRPGEVLGVLGRTGSGKTTLARLLLRLHDPVGGRIAVGDVDLRAAAMPDLRARIGMVSQQVQLFHASVRDNLTLFNRSIADERIIATLGELGLWEWFRDLPAGLDSPLAPGSMSGGEAQLLAFARVFLRQPGLVILDEASSRLDPATERRTERAVGRLLEGRTGLVIAHRLATVERADRILILEDGRIAELGPRGALAADPGSRFAALLRLGLAEALA